MFRTKCIPVKIVGGSDVPAATPFWSSTEYLQDAVDKAIKRAHKTIKNLCWFQVIETRGNINKGRVDHWQVTIKVGFTVEA